MAWKKQETFDLNTKKNRQRECIKAQEVIHLYSDVKRYKLLLENLNKETNLAKQCFKN